MRWSEVEDYYKNHTIGGGYKIWVWVKFRSENSIIGCKLDKRCIFDLKVCGFVTKDVCVAYNSKKLDLKPLYLKDKIRDFWLVLLDGLLVIWIYWMKEIGGKRVSQYRRMKLNGLRWIWVGAIRRWLRILLHKKMMLLEGGFNKII